MQRKHVFVFRVLVVCVCLVEFCPPDCAQGDTQIFPVPSVSTSKNDGSDAGLIVPILISDPDGELKYLMAPMLIQNSIVGTRGAFNLFRYEPGGREMRRVPCRPKGRDDTTNIRAGRADRRRADAGAAARRTRGSGRGLTARTPRRATRSP